MLQILLPYFLASGICSYAVARYAVERKASSTFVWALATLSPAAMAASLLFWPIFFPDDLLSHRPSSQWDETANNSAYVQCKIRPA